MKKRGRKQTRNTIDVVCSFLESPEYRRRAEGSGKTMSATCLGVPSGGGYFRFLVRDKGLR